MKLLVLLERKDIGIVLYGHGFDMAFVIALCVSKVLLKVLSECITNSPNNHAQNQYTTYRSTHCLALTQHLDGID